MEEKVLIKGVFGGKFMVALLWMLSIAVIAICIACGIINHEDALIVIGVVCGIPLIIFAIVLSAWLKKRELIVTNKRVIARAAFGYRTDLPLEKVANVSMCCFGGISCGTPSKKIRFYFCNNKQAIFDAIASEILKRDSAFSG